MNENNVNRKTPLDPIESARRRAAYRAKKNREFWIKVQRVASIILLIIGLLGAIAVSCAIYYTATTLETSRSIDNLGLHALMESVLLLAPGLIFMCLTQDAVNRNDNLNKAERERRKAYDENKTNEVKTEKQKDNPFSAELMPFPVHAANM